MRFYNLNRLFPDNGVRMSSPSSITTVFLLTASLTLCLILGGGDVGAQEAVDDHGDTLATATAMAVGTSTLGRIDPGNDMDVFKIDLSRASRTTDLWAYTTGEHDTVGGLYDGDENLLAFNDDSYTLGHPTGFSLRKAVLPGVYYVVVASHRAEPGDYNLHSEAVRDPGSALSRAKRLALDSPAAGTIGGSNYLDYFRLDLTESASLIIEARTSNLIPITANLVEARDKEIPSNIYPLFVIGSGFRTAHGFQIRDDFGPGVHYIRVSGANGVVPQPAPYTILAVDDIQYTAFIQECEAKTSSLDDPEVNDPLYSCQWHLNDAEDEGINVESVWEEGIKGEGVTIAVVDYGMDYSQEDLKDNVDTALNHDYTGNNDIYSPLVHHGTHVAGIIAARDNSVGVRGVAPRATIYGYNALAEMSIETLTDAMTRNSDVTAVSNNSWGFADGPWLTSASEVWREAVRTGITTGYDGKGTFYVFRAGDGHMMGDNSNLDEYVNHYAVTAVCAVNSNGVRASYSEMGANLWVCAPSNDRPTEGPGVLTTEHSDRYMTDFGGTSASTPMVSGVAALMREANPDLTWRDLKLILAASARKNDPENSGWKDGAQKYRAVSDAGRYHFNHEYGFGAVDAEAAVNLAKKWTNAPPLVISTTESGKLGLEMPDASAGAQPTPIASAIKLDTGIYFTEFVEVEIALEHESFRDLEIELVSPSGAVSKLAVPFDTSTDLIPISDFVPMYGSFRFGSARHLGEDPNGVWTLRITDHIHVGEGIILAWNITVYGHERTPAAPIVDSVTTGVETLTVAWTAPSQPVDSVVTAYDIRYMEIDSDETVDSNWTVIDNVWTTAGGGDLEYTITGLTAKVQYDVQVRAINSWGAGRWSETSTGIPGLNLLKEYDRNNNGVIDRDEAVMAVADYFSGIITREEAIAVIALYFAG